MCLFYHQNRQLIGIKNSIYLAQYFYTEIKKRPPKNEINKPMKTTSTTST